MSVERRSHAKWNNLYLLRHGESTCNEVNRFAGAIDAPLTFLGEAQARKAAEFWQGEAPDIIFTSPLIRARHTADIIFPKHKAKPEAGTQYVIDERISERNFGEFTLRNKALIQREVGLRQYEAALYGDNSCLSGGESFAEFHQRVLEFLRDVLHPLLEQQKRVLVVGHKYVIELLSRLILRLPADDGYDLRLPNAKIFSGSKLYSYVRNESKRLNLLQDWIVLNHSFVLLFGVVAGIFLKYVNLLTAVPPIVPLFVLALATGISLARVDIRSLGSFYSEEIALGPMFCRYLLLPLLLGSLSVFGGDHKFVFFLAILLAAPSAITGITISRTMGGLVSPTVRTIILSTVSGTMVMLPLLAAHGTDFRGPALWLFVISGVGLGLPLAAVKFLRQHHPIATANFAERNGATAVLLLTVFIVLSFSSVDLSSFWPDAFLPLVFAVLLRMVALVMTRRSSLYAVDDYIAMSYPNIFFVVVLTSVLGLEGLLGMATWYLLPMFALAPFDEWLCKKFLAPAQDNRLLSYLRVIPAKQQAAPVLLRPLSQNVSFRNTLKVED